LRYKKQYQGNRITTRQILTIVLGLSIVVFMSLLWINNGSSRFFALLIRFRGKYLNEAYFLVIGLVILGFGLFDIYATKHKKKQ